MKEIAAAVAGLAQEEIATIETQGSILLALASGEVCIEIADVEIATEDLPGWLVANEGNLTIALDIEVSEALRQEGIARELVNRIQNIRKTSGYEITDKISVNIEAREEITEAVENHKDYIASQVLATSLCVVEKIDNPTPLDFEDFVVNIFIEKA